MRSFFQRHTVLIAALVIFGIALFARSGALKQYVAPDEPSWVWRSINFSRARAEGEWAGTAQMGHPGVTTMWLGSLGILAKRAADPVASDEAIQWVSQVTPLAPENAEAFKRLGVFLTYARIPVILINALGVVLVYLLARRLWGQRVGVMAPLFSRSRTIGNSASSSQGIEERANPLSVPVERVDAEGAPVTVPVLRAINLTGIKMRTEPAGKADDLLLCVEDDPLAAVPCPFMLVDVPPNVRDKPCPEKIARLTHRLGAILCASCLYEHCRGSQISSPRY